MIQFLWGALFLAAWVIGLFFLRFWSQSRDRLFLFFCLAFWSLSAHWLGVAIINPVAETRHYLFLLRLLAFALIIVAIVDKNRRAR